MNTALMIVAVIVVVGFVGWLVHRMFESPDDDCPDCDFPRLCPKCAVKAAREAAGKD